MHGRTKATMIIPRLSVAAAVLLASSGGANGAQNGQTSNDATALFLRGSNVDPDMYRRLTENSVKVTALRGAFTEWVEEHKRIYESVEDEMERMLIWIENHGEFALSGIIRSNGVLCSDLSTTSSEFHVGGIGILYYLCTHV